MFLGGCVNSLLAPSERHLRLADAAPTELNAALAYDAINIALLRS